MLTAVKRIMEELKLAVNERKTRCLRCPEEPMEFLGYRIGRNYRSKGREPTSALDPAGRGSRHLPQDQREDGAEERESAARRDGRRAEPGHNRLGELLLPGAGQPGLPSDRPPRGSAAASVALSEAQGEVRGNCALLGRETMENLWTHLPGVKPQSHPWAKA